MTPAELNAAVAAGTIDTVVVGFTDHYGRLLGKRFDAGFFLEAGLTDGTHACDYLLTVDMAMEPVEGFDFSDWSGGYGDFHLVPDTATLRPAGWTDRTAIVLCDVESNDTHKLIDVAPRSILRRQVDRLTNAGFHAAAASELEFFLYRDSYRTAHEKNYHGLDAAGWYVEDYHLVQGARVEDYVGAARRALSASDIPVENSKGEAAIGQHELNVRYAEVLTMADRHVVLKQGMKELADQLGVSVSFMAKPHADQPGSSCHLHVSLWQGGANVFTADDGDESDIFRWFLGGWMHHTARPHAAVRTHCQLIQALSESVVGSHADRLVTRQPHRIVSYRRYRFQPPDRMPTARRRHESVSSVCCRDRKWTRWHRAAHRASCRTGWRRLHKQCRWYRDHAQRGKPPVPNERRCSSAAWRLRR